jgi:hypothetical protein
MTRMFILVLVGLVVADEPRREPDLAGAPEGAVPQVIAGLRPRDDRTVQLRNESTGVTCTMRIVGVEPTIDRGILARESGPRLDPIVRNSASPCVE